MRYPVIDDRKFENIIEEAEEIVPYFTPEWKFSVDNPDIGTALLMIVALQLEESIDLLNKSLYKNFISYLNYLNISINPPKSAKVPVVFNLSEGFKGSVVLDKGTRLLGKNSKYNKLVSFETDSNVELVSSKISNIFTCSFDKDSIVNIEVNKKNFICFEDTDNSIQEHTMYISEESILTCAVPMEFEITFKYAEKFNLEILAHNEYVKWMYFSEYGWQEFDYVEFSEGKIKLIKNNNFKIVSSDFYNSRWIKCSVNKNKISYVQEFSVNAININAKLINCNSYLKKIKFYYNDKILENESFLPFGYFFNQYDNFYIGADEIFSKKSAEIELSFQLKLLENEMFSDRKKIDWKLIMKNSEFHKDDIESIISIHTVKWQYWNGSGWKNIEIDKKFERIFYAENFTKNNIIKFICPQDITQVEINGEIGYFIRLSIDKIENAYSVNGKYMCPTISNVILNFNYKRDLDVEKVIAYNNLTYENIIMGKNKKFNLFKNLQYKGNSIYLCFDYPFKNELVNLLFLIEKMNNKFIYNKKMRFQYLAKEKGILLWKEKNFYDETKALTQSGIIVLDELSNFKEAELFGKKGYWIRFILEKEDDMPRNIKGIFVNGVWATQQLSINNEFIDTNGEIYLTQKPVIYIELWINEIESLGKIEINNILDSTYIEHRDVYDDFGILKELWIKWKPVEQFYDAASNDRVYKIDYFTGKIEFGDGVKGKAVPFNLKKGVYVNYKVGGGEEGNVEAGEVNKMENSIAFIDTIYNPYSAKGGTGIESLKNAIERGIKKIRHRDRGVTVSDLEALAKEVSEDIYAVKCITNVNNLMKKEIGAINLVVLLKDKITKGMTYELKDKIENYLKDRISYHLVVMNKLYISDAEIVEVNLNINVTVDTNYNKSLLINNLKKVIDKFLDYRIGNYYGQGWNIGEVPGESLFYNIISEQKGILNTNSVAMSLYKINDKNNEITFYDASQMKNIIIISGKHNINVNEKN